MTCVVVIPVNGLTVNFNNVPLLSRIVLPFEAVPVLVEVVPPVLPLVVDVCEVVPEVELAGLSTWALTRAVKENRIVFGLLNRINLFPLSSFAIKYTPTS